MLRPVPRSRIFLPWRWRRCVPSKRQFTQDLHGPTSQKMETFNFINLSALFFFFALLALSVCYNVLKEQMLYEFIILFSDIEPSSIFAPGMIVLFQLTKTWSPRVPPVRGLWIAVDGESAVNSMHTHSVITVLYETVALNITLHEYKTQSVTPTKC
jgi:hypothetical protein